jgi:hypothetical protein
MLIRDLPGIAQNSLCLGAGARATIVISRRPEHACGSRILLTSLPQLHQPLFSNHAIIGERNMRINDVDRKQER